MGKVSDLMIEAQEFVLGYIDKEGALFITEPELYALAHQYHGIFFADCVKQAYKDMMEGW